jgi:ParB family chromosome partitioning protein
MPNRFESSFEGQEFAELCRSIKATGTNLQPIAVREMTQPDGTVRYDLVFGERRLRACGAIGIKVRALVAQRDSVAADPLHRLGENMGRKDLSALEFGLQVKHVLDGGLGFTKTTLAARLGCSLGHIGRAYDLASLPVAVLSAFQKPNELQFRDMLPLRRAYASDPDAVAAEAERILQEPEPPPTSTVVRRLVDAGNLELAPCKPEHDPVKPQPMRCGERDIGNWRLLPTGAVALEIMASMSDLQRQGLVQHIQTYVERKVLGRKAAASAADLSQSEAGAAEGAK